MTQKLFKTGKKKSTLSLSPGVQPSGFSKLERKKGTLSSYPGVQPSSVSVRPRPSKHDIYVKCTDVTYKHTYVYVYIYIYIYPSYS